MNLLKNKIKNHKWELKSHKVNGSVFFELLCNGKRIMGTDSYVLQSFNSKASKYKTVHAWYKGMFSVASVIYKDCGCDLGTICKECAEVPII